MSEGVQQSEDVPVAVTGGPVTLTRTVERKSSGVTATYELSTDERAVGVRVRDDLPGGLGEDDVGFHPEFDPHVSAIDGDEVTFEAVVRPERSTRVVLGVVAADAGFETVPVVEALADVSPADVEADASLFPESDGGLLGGLRRALGASAAPERPTNEVVTDPAETPGDDRSLVAGAEPAAEMHDADDVGGTDASEEADADASEEPSAGEDADASGEGDADVDSGDGESATPEESDVEDETEQSEMEDDAADETGDEASETVGEVTGDETADLTDAADDEMTADASDTDVGEGRDGDARDERESVAAALVAELEAGAVSEAERDALRAVLVADEAAGSEEADDGDASGEPGDASVGVRVDHLQARVEEFGAYASALEAIIDDYGAADGFVRETEESLDDLEARVGDLRSEVASLDERDDLASSEDLDALRASVDDVADEVAADREAREEANARFDRRVSRVEDDLDALASDVRGERDEMRSDLDDVRAEVRDLRGEVEEMAAMREQLAAAFGGGERRPSE